MPAPIKLDWEAVLVALMKYHGHRCATARMLGVSPATLRRELQREPSILEEFERLRDPSLREEAAIYDTETWSNGHNAEQYRRYERYFRYPARRRMTDAEVGKFMKGMKTIHIVE